MSEEPLRPYGSASRARAARTLHFSSRSPLSILLGLVLVGVAVAALFLSREPSARDATAPITTGAVETGLGPVVDLRRNEEPASDRAARPEADLPDDLAMLDGDTAAPRRPSGGAKIIEVPLDVPGETAPDRPFPVAPLPELIEDAPAGPLPRIADTGLTPFEAYRVPDRTAAASRVAIVVGGLGLSQTGTQKAIRDLPESVTLAFSPDGASLDRWARAARREGHELALQLPLEPLGWPEVNPGRFTLTRGAADNIDTLHEAMARSFSYAAIVPYLGTAFLGDEKALAPVLREIAERGLGWIDNGRHGASRSAAVATALEGEGVALPSARVAIVLDDERDADAIDAQLDALAKAARADGRAVALASAFDVSVERIALFVRTAHKRGIRVVPVSNLMR